MAVTTADSPLPIAVLGAGLIGCYLGGRMLAHGLDVTLIGRESLREDLSVRGLTVTDGQGYEGYVAPARVRVETAPAVLRDAGTILLTVKSQDTPDAAAQIAAHAPPGCTIVSLQNGVRNREVLQKVLPDHRVLAGMVPFNVVRRAPGHYHCATEGVLAIEPAAGACAPVVAALRRAGLPVHITPKIQDVLWGKLIVNLNNPINALSGLPLREQLRQRGYRLVLAASMREALNALRTAGIRPARVGKLPPALLPAVLSLPDWMFAHLAAAMLKVDPTARSSTWEDLERRRPTEVDYLNGEVVALSERHGRNAPVNRKIVSLIKQAELAACGSPNMSAEALRDAAGLR